MAFKYGYRIEKGILAGEVLQLSSLFPQKENVGGWSDSKTVDSGNVDNGNIPPGAHYFNPLLTVQVECTEWFKVSHDPNTDYLLAAVPLYVGQGSAETKTGYFCVYIKPYNNLTFEWSVHCRIEDLDGNTLGSWTPFESIGRQHGVDYWNLAPFRIFLCLAGWTTENNESYLGMYMNLGQWQEEGSPGYLGHYWYFYRAAGSCVRLNDFHDHFGIYVDGCGEPIESDPELGEASEPEGYDMDGTGPGTYDDSSDSISNVPDPSYGILDAGFVNVYKVSTGALQALGNDVFPQLSAVTDLVSGLQCVSDMIFNSRLIDYILDVHILPCAVPAEANATPVKVGGRTCSALGYPVTNNYVNVDLGTISIGEYFKNFADYSFTSSKLHLPLIGFVDMKPEFWNGGELNVKYKFNVADGSFMAYVYATSSKSKLSNSLVAQYSGQAAIHIPVTGASYASAISGLIASAGGTIASATTGNIAGVAAGVVSAAANSSPDINQSNGYNSSASIMGCKKAYLQIERPAYSMSVGSSQEQGFPLNVYKRLGDCQGLTVVEECVLNFACSDEEAKEIKAALKEGVIV